jgi:uncharacterized membrane protein YedE/YeeE
LLLFGGKIAGVSGILWSAIKRPVTDDITWRWLFVVGMLLGTFLFHAISGAPIPDIDANYPLAALAGVLVGIGVNLGNGCTSGHGVCGIGRLSPRSLVATVAFMLTAIITVFVVESFG